MTFHNQSKTTIITQKYNARKSPLLKISGVCVSIVLLAGLLFNLSSCDSYSHNPKMQTIPTSSEQWQDKLGDTLDQLSDEDRQLLSRYMLRMKLSDAYEKGAIPRITIGKAIEQQRKYETLHPDNPTGRKSPVKQMQQSDAYPIILLPAQTSTKDSLNNVELSFVLTNNDTVAISSFKGTLMMRYPGFKKAKPVVIALTQFDPPIEPKSARKLTADVSISDTNVMKAIQNPQNIEIVITNGSIELADGQEVIFD